VGGVKSKDLVAECVYPALADLLHNCVI